MDINHFLHFVVATHENTRSVVDVLWYNFHHPLHFAVDSLTAGLKQSVSDIKPVA
jgi:hypothetical protein